MMAVRTCPSEPAAMTPHRAQLKPQTYILSKSILTPLAWIISHLLALTFNLLK